MGRSDFKNSTINFIDIEEVYNVRIVQGKNIKHSFKEHLHSTLIFGIITNGEIILSVGDEEYNVGEKQGYFLLPQTTHSIKCNENCTYDHLVICIDLNCIDEFNKFEFVNSKKVLINNQIYYEVKEIVDILSSDKVTIDVKKRVVKNLINKRLGDDNFGKIKNFKSENYNDKSIKSSIKVIKENYYKNLTLDDLAKNANMSKFHYSREFKKIIGISPYDYFLQFKIKQSQIILEQCHNITDATYSTGFYDQSHFTKYFKQFVGISPNEYVENHKKV